MKRSSALMTVFLYQVFFPSPLGSLTKTENIQPRHSQHTSRYFLKQIPQMTQSICKLQASDPIINQWRSTTVRYRFSSVQSPCSTTCCCFDMYQFIVTHQKVFSDMPHTFTTNICTPMHQSAQMTAHCMPFWVRLATSSKVYLYPFLLPPQTNPS